MNISAPHTVVVNTVPAWFDSEFYLLKNPDVAAEGNDPWLHCRQTGWREFRNPSAEFDLWWYWVWHLDSDLAKSPIEHYLEQGQQRGLDTRLKSGQQMNMSRKTYFNTQCLTLLEHLDAPADIWIRIANNLSRMELNDVADMMAVRACSLAPKNAVYQRALAKILLQRANGWRRAIDALTAAISLDDSHAEWFRDLGYANERLGLLDDAVTAYRNALSLDSGNNSSLYRLGKILESLNQRAEAAKAYAQMTNLDIDVEELGVGIMHQRENDWVSAEHAFRERLALTSSAPCARLHYAHGFSLEMLYRWEEAAQAYASAIAFDTTNPDWYYRLGSVLERLESYSAASVHYQQALTLRDESDWRYRQAVCLFMDGDLPAAISCWLVSLQGEDVAMKQGITEALVEEYTALTAELATSTCEAETHFVLGWVCERLGKWREAANAYRHAALRRNDYDAKDYYRLGVVLWQSGELDKACQAFRETRIYKRDFSHIPLNKPLDIKALYAECLDTLPVESHVILYESFAGASISCNPLAIFKRSLERFEGQGWLHVWVVKPDTPIPQEYKNRYDVVFVRHGSALYLRYLATAGWLINNVTFMPYFVRRPEQRYLNTWHGTPLKTLGVDIRGSLLDHKNITRNLLLCTHLIQPNLHTGNALLASCQVSEVFTGQLAHTGQPRVDLMLNADEVAKEGLRQRLGITEGEKLVLYAPTWRGHQTGPVIDAELIATAITCISHYPVRLLFSGHHLVARKLGNLPSGAMQLPPGVDITEVMSVVDVLITDYSSILFDFLPAKRPIILYMPDLEAYRQERGFYLDIETLPCQLCYTVEQLDASLADVLKNTAFPSSTALDSALKEFCPQEDGNAAERTMTFFFDDDKRHVINSVKSTKLSVLFHAGPFNPNGITSSFNRLVSALDPEKIALSLIAEPWNLESYPRRLERFAELPQHVRRWGRVSYPVMNAEEEGLLFRHIATKEILSERALSLLNRAFQREYRRMFGWARIDTLIDFTGFSAFWSSLFSRGRPEGIRNVIYFHNEMRKEQATKQPLLTKVFEQYPLFDALISVSQALNELHQRDFSQSMNIDTRRFGTVENVINPKFIRLRAQDALPENIRMWCKGYQLIGTVGRLSPEKGHHRLIDAFYILHQLYPKLRLVIAGDGHERNALVQKINQCGLDDSVLLTGNLYNPYPLMKLLDLFVLPSFHEGQPVVLLEALTLEVPILATDIPGSRSVLGEGKGILVEGSTEGLVTGIRQWLNLGSSNTHWDADRYLQDALEQFYRVAQG